MRSASLETSSCLNDRKWFFPVDNKITAKLPRLDYLKLFALVAAIPAALVAMIMLAALGDINFASTASGLTTDLASVSGPIQAMQGGVEGFGN